MGFPWALAMAAVNIGTQYLSESAPNVGSLAELQMVRQLATLNQTLIETNITLQKLIEAVQEQDEEIALGKVVSSTFEAQKELERLLLQIRKSRTFEDSSSHLEALDLLYGTNTDRIQNSLMNNLIEQLSILKQYSDKEFILVTLSLPIVQTVVSLLMVSDFLLHPEQIFQHSKHIEKPDVHPEKIESRPLGDHVGDLEFVANQVEEIVGEVESYFNIFEEQFHGKLEKFRDSKIYQGQDVIKHAFRFPDRQTWRKYRTGGNFSLEDIEGVLTNKIEVTTIAPIVFSYTLPFALVGQERPIDLIAHKYRFWALFEINKVTLEAFTEDYFVRKRPKRFVDLNGFWPEGSIGIEQPRNDPKASLEKGLKKWREENGVNHVLPLYFPTESGSQKIFNEKVNKIDSEHWKKGIEESVRVYTQAAIEMGQDHNGSENGTINLDYENIQRVKYDFPPLGMETSFNERAEKVSELLQIRIYMERFRRSLWAILDQLNAKIENST